VHERGTRHHNHIDTQAEADAKRTPEPVDELADILADDGWGDVPDIPHDAPVSPRGVSSGARSPPAAVTCKCACALCVVREMR
jgi:hypothetical protein